MKIMMRINICILLLFSFFSVNAEWLHLRESGVFNTVVVYERNPAHIFVSTKFGIEYSKTGGETWKSMSNPTTEEFVRISVNPFNDAGIIVQTPWNFFISYDYGENWQRIENRPPSNLLSAIRFSIWHEGYVYYTTYTGIYKSLTGGREWEKQCDGNFRALGLSAQARDLLIAHPQNGTIIKSTDGGISWQPTGPLEGGLFSKALYIHPQDKKKMYAMAFPYVYKTTDGGDHWQIAGNWSTIPEVHNVYDIDFYEHDPDVIIMGTDKGVFRTDDAGQKWYRLEPGIPHHN
ncbi:hypothetical protein JW935_14460, partial [candidate division KSB1 bacterium]|nr:hypothetical protein [candidate division KSB1 bacterium]